MAKRKILDQGHEEEEEGEEEANNNESSSAESSSDDDVLHDVILRSRSYSLQLTTV